MADKRPEDMIKEASGKRSADLFPAGEESHLNEMLATKVPKQHHGVVIECARHYANETDRYMAAAAAALVTRELFEPNSSYGMWPIATAAGAAPPARGANATPGTVYQLGVFLGGVPATGLGQAGSPGTLQFKRGQRFFGIMTGPVDSNAGWTFAGNTVALATDAISGIETDTSFAIFRPEIVKGRMIRGEYESRKIIEIVPFTAQAFLPVGIAAAPMVEGVSILFWDSRCVNQELQWADLDVFSYDDLVRDIVEKARAGTAPHTLLRRYLPEHLRNRYAGG
jgi:hypothetical protein